MRRKKAASERKPDWHAPSGEEARTELRKKATRRWPHPKGTPVTFYEVKKRTGFQGPGKHTRTRSISFYSKDGKLVVFLEEHAGYVLASHCILRELPDPQHWSD